ncbi:MAG: N-6 DNA methylase [Flavobacteriales bacterium]|nr:N-6 DNA methylase [Flavobacteriales bacterium]
MGKKLVEIQKIVEDSPIDFLEYIKRNVSVDVYEFLLRLSEITEVYIFSGVIRNFFLQKEEIRDLDVVIKEHVDIESFVNKSISVKHNSFGGYKINMSEINIDLWTLEKTWAVQYQKRLELDDEVDNLYRFIPSTAFFNFSAILFSLNEKRFYYKNDFLRFLSNREINYVYIPNANYSLCVVNSLYYADKYKLKIADKLKRFLIQLYKTKLNFTDIQLKHFGRIEYSEEEIKTRISNFKIDKRSVSDYITENLDEVFTGLGLSVDNGLFITTDEKWKTETAFPNRVKRLIENELKPDAFFCFDNKPLVLFFENPTNKYDLHKAIWNFNESPIVIIIENNIVEIFNGFNFDFKLELLKKIGKGEKLTDFTYFNLVTGKTWEQYKTQLHYTNRVDYNLLQNIKSARKLLVKNLDAKIGNAIIGKAIFVRYLIDRKVKIKFDDKLRAWDNSEFCDLLSQPKKIREFFDYLDDDERGFKGDLFPITPEDYEKITVNDYLVIKRLLEGEDIETNQPSLFDFYDFSIIPIEFISNVYELFIGQDNQKKEGAYYTPLFLVDYILKETVGNYLSDGDSRLIRLNEILSEDNFSICKVLDPACGSGIFLVETLRKIIEAYTLETGIDVTSELFKTAIKNLAKENIFGIDKDLSAVQVAIFSIYLTLLDYLEPPDIENFKFPELLNTNFFEADFFDCEASFNSKLKHVEFQFILGNPPWKGNGMDSLGNSYLKNRKRKEKELGKKYEIAVNNNEIAEGFILRVSDFSSSTTQVSLIVRSSSLYNLGYNSNGSSFRKYWLEEFYIDKIFELAPVRHEVFEKSNQPAIAPAVVLFYRYANGENTDNNLIQHITLKQSRFFSLFKIFTINRSDYKVLNQKKFKDFDWIWKVLVYGSYLDFNFLKRLKSDYPTIKEIVSNDEKYSVGTGVQFSSNPTYDATHLFGKPFLDAYGVSSFFINPESISSFAVEKLHRLRNDFIFKSPMLLMRKGLDMKTLKIKSAISKKDVLFKDSLTSISTKDKKDIDTLYNILGVFSSSLLSYYSINTFGSVGVEREQTQNYNKFSLPYLDLEVKDCIVKIENDFEKIYSEKKKILHDNIKITELNESIDSKIKEIDEKVFKGIEINDLEFSLIDYAINVNSKLIIGTPNDKKKLYSPIKLKDSILENYAQLFIKRFKTNLSNSQKKFIVEIWHTNQVIGMFFKLVDNSDYSKEIIWIDKQNQDTEVISVLTKISTEKITDKLFVQKDVRGFGKDYFHIFKPNEKRLWHKAIGYLDVNEFADAILKEGRTSI